MGAHACSTGGAPGVDLILANYGDIVGGTGYCSDSVSTPGCDPTCGINKGLATAYTWAVQQGASVLQDALALSPQAPYPFHDRYIDWRANSGGFPTIVTVTGQSICQNNTPGVSFHTCYNCIVTGAVDDQDDRDRTNDATGSICSNNAGTGLEVPHVAGVGNRLRLMGLPPSPAGTWRASGAGSISTSFASPQVSSIAALLMGEDPILQVYPEAVRAIIMATSTNDTDGSPLDLTDMTDDKDGAGEINAGLAAELIRSGASNTWSPDPPTSRGYNIEYVDQSNDFDANDNFVKHLVLQAAPGDQTAQVTLTWTVATTCPSDSNCPSATNPVSHGGYEILVYAFNNLVQIDLSTPLQPTHHNYVHVRFPVYANVTYSVYIRRIYENTSSPPASPQFLGLAWTTFTTAEE